jgi:hypothetical protein
MNVGAADRGCRHADQGVAGTDIRNRLRFEDDAAWSSKDGGFHFGHAFSPMCKFGAFSLLDL